jgi:hypothetical protein
LYIYIHIYFYIDKTNKYNENPDKIIVVWNNRDKRMVPEKMKVNTKGNW